jgi:hypothetical protein
MDEDSLICSLLASLTSFSYCLASFQYQLKYGLIVIHTFYLINWSLVVQLVSVEDVVVDKPLVNVFLIHWYALYGISVKLYLRPEQVR